jgi:hypothetical protein
VRQTKPTLSADVETELRRLGVEGVRDLLRLSREAVIQLPNSEELSRAEALDWIRWENVVQERREDWRFLIVVVGALAAVIAAIEGWSALKALF